MIREKVVDIVDDEEIYGDKSEGDDVTEDDVAMDVIQFWNLKEGAGKGCILYKYVRLFRVRCVICNSHFSCRT